MDTIQAQNLIDNLQELIKSNDKAKIYDFMSNEFKSKVKLEHYMRLDKYRINLAIPISLVKIYENTDNKVMIRIKQHNQNNCEKEKYANILFILEDDNWKLRAVLNQLKKS